MTTKTTPSSQTNGASDGGAAPTTAPSRPAPSRPALLRPPTLQEAVAALPLTGSGDLTREKIQGLANAGDVFRVLLGCLDEMDRLPGLVEALQAAGDACADLPIQSLRIGTGTLAELIADKIRRTTEVVRGALGELEP